MITVGMTVKIARTKRVSGRGNAVGVVTKQLGPDLFEVETRIRDIGPCLLVVRGGSLR